MKIFERMLALCVACCCMLFAKAGVPGQDSTIVPITGADAFDHLTRGWVVASEVTMGMTNSKVTYSKGSGILLGKAGTDDQPVVLNEKVSGDIELELDFMVAAESDPALCFLGKYQLSLAGDRPGTVEVNAHAGNPLLGIRVPTVNVAKAPGLWQHLKIRYRAADNDPVGGNNKPHFEAVYLNGVLIHQQLYLTTETSGDDISGMNPLLSFTRRNGAVAFRNIGYRKLLATGGPESSKDAAAGHHTHRVVNPIVLNPGTTPYLLRSYLMFAGRKRTHVISVGNPNHSNFSYDLKQGALLQVWKGKFMDVTSMWESRGEPQTATPLGAPVELTAKPAIAMLHTRDESWPDSIGFDEMHSQGYSIDAAGTPTFRYEFSGMQVTDKISHHTEANSLTRELTVTNLADNVNCLVAVGKDIIPLGKGLYAVNDKSYYVRVHKQSGTFVRKSPVGEELIVPLNRNGGHVVYSLTW